MYVLNRGSVSIGFIPDICDLVDKYNLHFVLNDFFAYNGRLPSKTTWKNTVNNVIHQKESNAWEQRLSSDSEFWLFFKLFTLVLNLQLFITCTLEVNPKALLEPLHCCGADGQSWK